MVKRQFDYEERYQLMLDKLEEFKQASNDINFKLEDEIQCLENKMKELREIKYHNLSAWEKLLLSRQADRPGSSDYIEYICDEWVEMHGDRCYGDDKAIIGGIGLFDGIPLTILGHRKGKNTNENIKYNFGMPHPEGYRKVERLVLQAEKFKRPVITFIDTPGAYPGLGAEERGQAWAISKVLMTLSRLKTPVIAVVTGEGGSGGALALAVSDRLLMLSNAVFSVVSPEGCASILYKDSEKTEEMAAALKMTAEDLYDLKIVDGIIEEPPGGAQKDFETSAANIKCSLQENLKQVMNIDINTLLETRYQKLRSIGKFKD